MSENRTNPAFAPSFGEFSQSPVIRSFGDGLCVGDDGSVTNWVASRPALADAAGHLRLGAVMFVADGTGGLAGGLACPDGRWVVTTDLDVRLLAPIHDARVRIVSRAVRAGSTTVVCEIDLLDDATGQPVGTGSITSHALETPSAPPKSFWPRGRVVAPEPRPADERPLAETLGIVDAPDGCGVDIPVAADVRNPWGILHGGIVAVGAEEAALRHPAGAGRPATAMLVRYLAPTRSGPARFVPELVGASDDAAVFRVRAYDVGHGDRLTSVSTVELGPRVR